MGDLNNYADALHDCIEQVENLKWDQPSDQKFIVKHLRGFIDRVTPGHEHTLEQALNQINLSILGIPISHESFRLLSQMGRDVALMQAHFMEGDILKKVDDDNQSILERIWRLFFGRQAPYDERVTLAKCQAKLNAVTSTLDTNLNRLQNEYCKDECNAMIDFLMRYNSEWAEDRKLELDYATLLGPVEKEVELLRIYKLLKDEIDSHAVEIVDLFQERFQEAPFHAFLIHQVHDLRFLRDRIEKGSFEMAKAIVNKWSPGTKNKKIKSSALQTLTNLEKNLNNYIKANEGLTVVDRLKGVIDEKLGYAKIITEPNLKDTLAEIEQAGFPKQKLPFVRSTLEALKEKYVKHLQESIIKVSDIYHAADKRGIPLLEKWAVELLRNDEFNQECADFAVRLVEEQDQFTKMRLFGDFLVQCKSKYGSKEMPGADEDTQLIECLFLSCPSKSFLEACFDLDPQLIGFATKGPYLSKFNNGYNKYSNMFAQMQQVLIGFFNPQFLPAIVLKKRLEQTKGILKTLPNDPVLMATQETLQHKLEPRKLSKRSLEAIESFVQKQEQAVQNHLRQTFERRREQIVLSFSLPERTLLQDLEKDATKLFTAMQKQKKETQKVEQFAKDFAALRVKYDVQDELVLPFLRRLILVQRGTDVASLIKNVQQSAIGSRIAPEPMVAAKERKATLGLLNEALDSILS